MPYDRTATTAVGLVVAEMPDAFIDASALLGGDSARARCFRLVCDLAETPVLTGRLRREVSWLIDLLGLQHVGDPDRVKTDMFARIDPCDPAIEQICELHDLLVDALAEASQIAA